jgi:pyrroloquinoline quinone biosynthesis protein D
MAAARSISAGGVMKPPALPERPSLKPGCRLSPESSREELLLIPEGALRLHGPGRRILQLCDGQRTLNDVIQALQTEFPTTEPSRISDEVVAFLTRLQEKGAIEFL